MLEPELLTAVKDLLTRPAIRAKSPHLTHERVDRFLELIGQRAEMFPDAPKIFTWPQHSDDDHVLNLSIHAQATRLVTWETRILNLATETSPAADLLRQLAPDLRIVTPKALAEEVTSIGE